ncbi:MAG: glutathione peroxidase [Ignavibacteria bacterium]|nr:glutathione peroxidase [Ignavibacteria bacterium]
MKTIIILSLLSIAFTNFSNPVDLNNIHDIKVKNIYGEEVQLNKYEGKVLLIINVASNCGYTKQYAGLQKIYEKYQSKGLEILAFPCNDFGGQEPGSNEQIQQFCSANFGVTFEIFDKIRILGDDKSPLYNRLINNSTAYKGDVKWNFEKFLISKTGRIIARFPSKTEPESEEIISLIEKEL